MPKLERVRPALISGELLWSLQELRLLSLSALSKVTLALGVVSFGSPL
jgi:hypothetical protein